jgi:hypothetical protein
MHPTDKAARIAGAIYLLTAFSSFRRVSDRAVASDQGRQGAAIGRRGLLIHAGTLPAIRQPWLCVRR